MRTAVDRFKWVMMAAILGGFLMAARSASAATTCQVDMDCPNSACGGDVCDWTKGETCQTAGGHPAGMDGWCYQDSDCKCPGATCTANYSCTFTVAATGSGGSGGGTGGAAGTTGSGGGTATGGTTGTAGKGGATGTAGAGAGGKGGSSSSPDGGTSSSSSGGCSVAGGSSPSLAGLLIACGALVAIRRRRRRG